MELINLALTIVAFTIDNDKLKVFLVKSDDKKILPRSKLKRDEAFKDAIERIIESNFSFSLKNEYVEQLYTFSSHKNNNTYIDIVYYILMAYEKIKKEKIIGFIDVRSASRSMNQDQKIIKYAVQRLRWKLEYTNVVYSLVPSEFTLSRLQQTYEAIFGRKLDKRNFRRKILSLNLIEKTGKEKRGEVARPAAIYRFKRRTPEIVKVFS